MGRLLDNLPAAMRIFRDDGQLQYQIGYPVGQLTKDGVHLNNYLKFHLKYHTDDS